MMLLKRRDARSEILGLHLNGTNSLIDKNQLIIPTTIEKEIEKYRHIRDDRSNIYDRKNVRNAQIWVYAKYHH